MPHLRSRAPALPALLAAALLMLTFAPAHAQSLMERRNAMLKGTNQGVVIIEATPDDNTAATGADGSAQGEKPTGLRAIFDKLGPPSGCPIGAARKAECPDQGIEVPTGAPSASNTPNFSR
ncbi:hypothetical protein DW355_01625 [Hylemonella gracilis]|uniref:Uncharacterized protein n=1 Tax=Hylemonella gracilis TaxID=80880 RepID=A0A4P6UHU9_9BURK|nr:hypothetical protein [Hylemonella gracilis]QBK03640.1 hypothetical protein DW355_01625 [Hylemonella gracilis]